MISWIQRTFQQHFRLVFGVLLVITIVSFIATIGNTGFGSASHTAAKREFFGRNIASQAEMAQIQQDAVQSLRLQYGDYAVQMLLGAPERLDSIALNRVAALHLADQWHLPTPQPDSSEVKDYIRGLPRFQGQNGQFDSQAYESFRSQGRIDGADLARVVADDLRTRQVEQILAGPGYIQNDEVMHQLELGDTEWTVSTATVDLAAYHPAIAATDAELTKYFQANSAKYMIPQQVEVSYVDFPASKYAAQVPVTDAELRAFYDRDPARFPVPAQPAAKDAAGKPVVPKADPNADFAKVKTQVEAAYRLDRAKNLAAKDASDFAYRLYQNKVTMGAQLDAELAASHLQQKSLPPFSQDAPPAVLGSSPDIGNTAFQLTAERFYSESLPTPTGAVVLLWKGVRQPRQPLLAEVKAKVTADYLESERQQSFSALGEKLKGELAKAIKGGATFDKAVADAAAAEKVKITPKAIPAFKLSDQPRDLPPSVSGALSHLNAGELSNLEVNGDQGVIVYAAKKVAPKLDVSNPRFAAMHAQAARYFANQTAAAFMDEYVTREEQRSDATAR